MNDVSATGAVSSPKQPPLRLFLVEDSALLRELVMEVFATIPGITLAGSSDSEDDAFARLHLISCDIVIVDIELKQGNGIALLRRLATQPGRPLINIILSNNVSPLARRVLDEFDVCFFFDKTTEFLQLQHLLEKLGTGIDVRTL